MMELMMQAGLIILISTVGIVTFIVPTLYEEYKWDKFWKEVKGIK